MKSECEKKHLKEECKEGSHCKVIKTCAMRHPQMCRRYVMEGVCHFAEKCAYKHKTSSNSHGDTVQDDVHKLKREVDNLKSAVKVLMKNREEEDILKKSIKDITDEVKLLSASNKYIKEQIDLLEKDSDTESDSDGEKQHCKDKTEKSAMELKCDECDYIGETHVNLMNHLNTKHVKNVDESHIKKSSNDFKCVKCDFVGTTEISLNKHVNTKHALKDYETSNKEACDMSKTEDIDGIEDLFQIEIVEGEELYACNVCNEGFEKEDSIKKHIEKDHFQVLLQIRKEMYEDQDDGSNGNPKYNVKHKHDDSLDTVSEDEETDGEDDEAFLAKFDDDGNLI